MHVLYTLIEWKTIHQRFSVQNCTDLLRYVQPVNQQELVSLFYRMDLVVAASNKSSPFDTISLSRTTMKISPRLGSCGRPYFTDRIQ